VPFTALIEQTLDLGLASGASGERPEAEVRRPS